MLAKLAGLPKRVLYVLIAMILVVGSLIWWHPHRANAASISYVCSSASAGSTTAPSCTGEQAGDLLVMWAVATNGTTIPTTPGSVSTYTSGNSAGGGGSSKHWGYSIGYATAASSTQNSGSWTGATNVIMHVYRGAYTGGLPFGGVNNNLSTTNTNTVDYPPVTLNVTNGSSWFIAFSLRNSGDSNITTAPTGMTNRSSDPTSSPLVAGFDSNGSTASNWSDQVVSGFSVTSVYESFVLELLAQPNVAPAAPTLSAPSAGATGVSLTPQFQLRTTDPDNDYLQYEVQVCSTNTCSSVISTACQFTDATTSCTGSQTGWSGQDQQTSTAYTGNSVITSSTLATYTYQSTLSAGTQYWWRAWAIDPGGSNTKSNAATIQTFTTNAVPAAPSLASPAQPLNGATGVAVSGYVFKARASDADGDYLKYEFIIYDSSNCTGTVMEDANQVSSQTGWSGQDAGPGSNTAYAGNSTESSSTMAQHNYGGTTFTNSHTYSWKAAATDPAGTNTQGSFSSCASFTTVAGANDSVNIGGGVNITGGTNIY